MQTPTRNILDNPDQHLRFQRQVVERLTGLEAMIEGNQTGLSALLETRERSTIQTVKQDLLANGQETLARLNINPNLATARSNIADSAPTATDDSSKGYGYHSQWILSTTNDLYICTNPAPGAAVWKLVS